MIKKNNNPKIFESGFFTDNATLPPGMIVKKTVQKQPIAKIVDAEKVRTGQLIASEYR